MKFLLFIKKKRSKPVKINDKHTTMIPARAKRRKKNSMTTITNNNYCSRNKNP